MDGLRKCFAKEFSHIYIFNLRGNQRTQGETSRREGGKIFGSGSRAPISITILVKDTKTLRENAKIFYYEVEDYLNREEKLAKIKSLHSVLADDFKILTPNEKGDWINQRGNLFENFLPLAPEKKFDGAEESFFVTSSRGIMSGRDALCYNFSKSELAKNIDDFIQKSWKDVNDDEVPLYLHETTNGKNIYKIVTLFDNKKFLKVCIAHFAKNIFTMILFNAAIKCLKFLQKAKKIL